VAGAVGGAVFAAPQAAGGAGGSTAASAPHVRNVVLVHGGFVDGSGWERVHSILKNDGYRVSVVQNPTTSLADDVAATRRVLAGQDVRPSSSATRMVAS
jgi:hypothetical protein